MPLKQAVLVVLALAWALPASAQQAPAPADGVAALLRRAGTILNTGDRAAFPQLFSAVPQPQIDQYATELFVPNARQTVIRERDRRDLEGAPKGDGYRV